MGADGTMIVNAGMLPVPSDQYFAECAWAAERHGAVSLCFGKFNFDDTQLKTRLEVRYSYEAFVEVFWKNSREFHALMRERGARRSALASSPSDLHPETLPVEKEHTICANLDVLSRAGNEACVDFFHLSARNLALYKHTKDLSHLDFVPIVRVLLTTDALVRLLDEGEPLVEKIRPLSVPEAL